MFFYILLGFMVYFDISILYVGSYLFRFFFCISTLFVLLKVWFNVVGFDLTFLYCYPWLKYELFSLNFSTFPRNIFAEKVILFSTMVIFASLIHFRKSQVCQRGDFSSDIHRVIGVQSSLCEFTVATTLSNFHPFNVSNKLNLIAFIVINYTRTLFRQLLNHLFS